MARSFAVRLEALEALEAKAEQEQVVGEPIEWIDDRTDAEIHHDWIEALTQAIELLDTNAIYVRVFNLARDIRQYDKQIQLPCCRARRRSRGRAAHAPG